MDFRKVTPDSINYLKSVSMTVQARLYIKLTKLHRVAAQNIWFNQQCKHLNVVPSYINLKTNTHSRAANMAVKKAETIWLNEEIRHWFTVRDNLKLHLKVLYTELSFKLHNLEFDCLDEKARNFASIEVHTKYINQQKKLQTLVNKNKSIQFHTQLQSEPFSFHPRVKNLTNVQLAKDEMTLLEKGLKHNITPKLNKKDLEMLAVDSEIAVVVSKKDNMVKGLLANEIKVPLSGFSLNPERVALRSLKQTINNNDLVVSKADKGNATVLMRRDDYLEKVNNIIQCDQFLNVPSDPTNKFMAKVKLAINNNTYLFPTESAKRKLIPMNPRAPLLYGLPKIHKADIPMRPVVSYIGAPAYELAKSLNYTIKQKLSFRPPYALKNSLQLVNQIKNVTLPPRCQLVSLDVESLFTNVPCKETLGILGKALDKRLPQGEGDEVLTLTKVCMEQNYFRFNNQFFVQKDGLAMGSPLSPLLAEIFMDDFEQRNIVNNKNILYYYRYVDDCILCWTGTRRQLDAFVTNLNKKHYKIKFTVECEINNTLNFLDLSITRDNDKHSFAIFRKPTYTNTTIHASSCHPWQHKLAAFHSYIHRLISIPLSEENYQKELSVICQIAESNGYSPKVVYNILNNKNKKELVGFLYAGTPDKEVVRYKSSLTYMGEVSLRLFKIMKNNDIHVAFRTNNTLKNQLCHSKDRIDSKYQSGVYRIDCPECDSVYVGQTGRNFETRYKEHIAAYRNGHRDRSHFAKHLLDSNHRIPDGHSYKVLHKCNKSFRLSVLEQLEIIKEKKNNSLALLNEQTCLTTSPLISMFGGGYQ